jgi:hypothetical protein
MIRTAVTDREFDAAGALLHEYREAVEVFASAAEICA